MNTTTHHLARWLGPVLFALAVTPGSVIAQGSEFVIPTSGAEISPTPFPPITTTVSGRMPLARHRSVALEYADSPILTALLERELSREGVPLAGPASEHALSVRVRGVLQLTGKHTGRIRISDLAEKGTLVGPADRPRTLAPADIGYVIAAGDWLGRLTQTGRIAAPVGAVVLVDLVGQATGAKDWFNKAIGGDRRGLCLANCENWHKTRQAALHVIEVRDETGRLRVEVRSELFDELLQPGRVVSAGLQTVVRVLADHAGGPAEEIGEDHAAARN